MAVNIKLSKRFDIDPTTDSMGRTWAGWDPDAADQTLWEHNRGRHTLGDRVGREQYATLSYDGRIRVVAEVTDRREEVNPTGTGRKWSLQGRVLAPGDPVREAFMRLQVPEGRNSIAYIDDPETSARRAFLMTYNPQKWEMDADELADWIEATAQGHPVQGRWSTGSTTRKISLGDRAFLLRQGVSDRGIFASGTFISRVFQQEHWDGSGGRANYADVNWDTVIDPDEALSIDVLTDQLPDVQWAPQASGTEVEPTAVSKLEELWTAHVAASRATEPARRAQGGPVGEGQGRRLDAALRKQIEDLAQARLTAYYESDGWRVQDRRHGNPFDAEAEKDGKVLYLEAKGTTTAGERVIVTRNEVAFARDHPGECVMGVLSDIKLTGDGTVDPSSGQLSCYDWNPADDDLSPLQYDYYPPSSQQLDTEAEV